MNLVLKHLSKKFVSAGFPRNIIRNTIKYFNKDKDDFIIPERLLDERKLIILQVPFSESKEKSFFKKSSY